MSRSIYRTFAASAAAAGLALFVTACSKPDAAGGAAPEKTAAAGERSTGGGASATASVGTPISLADLPLTAKTVTLGVTGMTCDACVEHITETLAAMDGVLQETVSLEEKSATVAYDPAKVKVEDLAAAITKLKYTVALPDQDATKGTGASTSTISGFPETPDTATAKTVTDAAKTMDLDAAKAAAAEVMDAAKTAAVEKGKAVVQNAKDEATEKVTDKAATALDGVPAMPEAPVVPGMPAAPTMPKMPGKH